MQKVYIASDHAGFHFKNKLIQSLKEYDWYDLGTDSDTSVDYPDYADKLAEKLKTENAFGLLICGSGQGMVMRANRHKHIRAALCWNEDVAELARAHNNANVLCLGARLIDENLAPQIVKKFISTPFEGGRHVRRVEKLSR
jgi:ribose 5-phosphate isomerase B